MYSDLWHRTLPHVDVRWRTSPYIHMHACRMLRRTVPYAMRTGLKDRQWWRHIYSNDRPWDNNCHSTSFAQRTACWPPRIMQCNVMTVWWEKLTKNMRFLVYTYYTHSGYKTSIFGKNCAYYIQIFTVNAMHKYWVADEMKYSSNGMFQHVHELLSLCTICVLMQYITMITVLPPHVGPGHLSSPLVHLLPHLFPFSLFPSFHWLYLFSSFVHPFPFYQNSPTPFPDRRS